MRALETPPTKTSSTGSISSIHLSMPAAEGEVFSSDMPPAKGEVDTTVTTGLSKGEGGVRGPSARRAETIMSPDPTPLTNMKRWPRKGRMRVNRTGPSRYKTLIQWINSLTFYSVAPRMATSVPQAHTQELSSSTMTLKLTTMSRVTIRCLRHTEVYSKREPTFL